MGFDKMWKTFFFKFTFATSITVLTKQTHLLVHQLCSGNTHNWFCNFKWVAISSSPIQLYAFLVSIKMDWYSWIHNKIEWYSWIHKKIEWYSWCPYMIWIHIKICSDKLTAPNGKWKIYSSNKLTVHLKCLSTTEGNCFLWMMMIISMMFDEDGGDAI